MEHPFLSKPWEFNTLIEKQAHGIIDPRERVCIDLCSLI
jgi:hypothetical protein